MTAEHSALWQRIEAFTFDEPGAVAPFSARLAREQDWGEPLARRVIEEYKRFAFLAVAAGHPVTPSKAIDEAWHLHLIYTRNYWEKFCAQALGRPLHHEPSRGGAQDEAKFAAGYAQTRESYARFFGVEPPADIWPAPGGGPAVKPGKSRWRKWLPFVVISGCLPGCSGAAEGPLGPFDLSGPDFLVFFAWFAPAVFVTALILRWWMRGPGTPLVRQPELAESDPYVVAALSGIDQVLGVALTNLSSRYLLRPAVKSRVIRAEGTLPAGAPGIERRIHELADHPMGADLEDLRAAIKDLTANDVARLRQAGLVLGEGAAERVRYVPFMVALFVPIVAGIKLLIGLSRGRPVDLLIVLGLATALVSVRFLRRTWRTRAGDALLAEWRQAHKPQKRRLPNGTLSGADGAMMVALFGASVWPLAVGSMYDTLKDDSSWSWGGTNWNSCTSSSCGGGSSCGGCSSGGH
ncbi:MAG: TIGR04222 domain-containing membrane protein [Verrucomicrobia bacterium]|nr:TIGR04222 domain-containing membrane protein [Verrucomicrobiota bacterium]